jgi:hypothetical protein
MDIREMTKLFLLIMIAIGVWLPYFDDFDGEDDCE